MNKKKLLRALTIVLAAVFVLSAGGFLMTLYEYYEEKKIYSAAQEEFLGPPKEEEPAPSEEPEAPAEEEPEEPAPEAPAEPPKPVFTPDQGVDFERLKALNSDIFGWIWIPGTSVNYPLLRCDDNSDYIRTSYSGKPNRVGSIFLDKACTSDLTMRNTVIYGHNMKNGTMFGDLLKYQNAGFAEKHPSVYIYTEDRVYEYIVFSAYTTEVGSSSYLLGFSGDVGFVAQTVAWAAQSVVRIDPGHMFIGGDHIITLSTCTNSGGKDKRFIVQAFLKELPPAEEEPEPEEVVTESEPPTVETEVTTEPAVQTPQAPQTPPKTEPVTQPETKPETPPETEPETQPETEPETQPETEPETPPEAVPETPAETPPETEPETPPETEPETQTDTTP